MEIILNLDKLIKIKVKDKEIYHDFKYRLFKKSIWSSTKEGFYSKLVYNNFSLSKEELETGKYHDIKFIVRENIVYLKPKVILLFSRDVKQIIEFDTHALAVAWAEMLGNKLSFRLEIENDSRQIIKE